MEILETPDADQAIGETADPFLDAVTRRRDVKGTGETEQRLGDSWRWMLSLLVIGALLASSVALVQGSRRARSSDVAARLATQPDTYEVAVTAPFAETRVVLVDHREAAIVASPQGEALLRVGSSNVGAVTGLSGADGAVVALGLLPPGLPNPPDELLVSPTSTALTLAALHPDLLSADDDTFLAHLVEIGRSSQLATVAALVDGSTGVDQLGEDGVAAVASLVADVERRLPPAEADCADPIAVDATPTVIWCEESRQLQNLSSRWVLVVDDANVACAVIAPVTRSVSVDEINELRTLISSGLAPVPGDGGRPAGEPGRLEPDGVCGGRGRVVVDPNAERDLAQAIVGYGVLYDDASAFARLLGADPTSLVTAQTVDPTLSDDLAAWIPSDVRRVAPAGRLRLASAVVLSPSIGERLGVGGLSGAGGLDVDVLRDLLIEVHR